MYACSLHGTICDVVYCQEPTLFYLTLISEVTSTTPLTPTTDTSAVTQQLQSSASLDGSASSAASAVFEPIKSDPSERESP